MKGFNPFSHKLQQMFEEEHKSRPGQEPSRNRLQEDEDEKEDEVDNAGLVADRAE
jgi:hypothetical protein